MDPKVILAQLLRGREIKVSVGDRMAFNFQRPTEMELIRLRNSRGQIEVGLSMLQDKCVGWDGILESDIVQGGASDKVEFDRVLYSTWIADRPDLWGAMLEALEKAIVTRGEEIKALKGN